MDYLTNNPIGSSDPRDLFDNAESFDQGMNSTADTFRNRRGQNLYTWSFFHRMTAGALAQINVTIGAAQTAVNQAATAAITEMEETAAALGDDLNNKRYATYAEMLADPQSRDAVVAVVDGDQDPNLNGWYSWDNVAKNWVRWVDQPLTGSALAKVVKEDFVSEEKAVLTANDEEGFTGFLAARSRIATRGIDLNSRGVITDRYAQDALSPSVTVMDEQGYAAVHLGEREMKAVLDAGDLARNSEKVKVSYAPITKSNAKLVAHRGRHYDNIAPENSLDGYRLAANGGFYYVETDIMRTADGGYVLCHDATINRTFMNKDGSAISGAVSVNANSLADLRTKYVFKSDVERFRAPIPTLEEFLSLCVEYNLFPWIELKDPSFLDADFVAVNDLCVRYLGNDFWYLAGGPSRLAAMRALNPNVMLGYVFDSLSESNYAYALNNKPACLDVNYLNLTPQWVARARKDGIPVAVFTVPGDAYSEVSKMGVDYIAGDDLAPELDRQQILFSDVANGDYSAYKHSGVIADGQVSLTAARYLTLKWDSIVPSGGAYLVVEYTGSLTVAAGKSTKAISSTTRKSYRTQVQLRNEAPGITLRGGTGGCTIHEISVAIAKF